MKRLRKGTEGQAMGLLPLLFFVFLDYYFSYIHSFIVSVITCFVCFVVYRWLKKDETYQFLLVPVSITLFFYSLALFLNLEPLLLQYSALLIEVLLIIVFTIGALCRRAFTRRLKNMKLSPDKKTYINASFNEAFYVAQIAQNLYTLHVFVVLFYIIFPERLKNHSLAPFIFQHLVIIIGLFIIFYEQMRLYFLRKYLRKEVWLPVLDSKGKVIGRIARSISMSSPRKYYHPVVRVALIYDGMLYLVKRGRDELVSPEILDYPFKYHVMYQQTFEDAALEAVTPTLTLEEKPRYLVRYTFESEKVKHMVSVFVVCLHKEEAPESIKHLGGKLWTVKQIQENLGIGVFSEYFEKEFPYLQNTILLAVRLRTKEITPDSPVLSLPSL